MLGETHGRVKPGDPAVQATNCRLVDQTPEFTARSMLFPADSPHVGACWKMSAGQDTYTGFISSNLGSRIRPNGLPASAGFRPWELLQQWDEPQANACNTIHTNPPYVPFP
jgi:hypothetical protein